MAITHVQTAGLGPGGASGTSVAATGSVVGSGNTVVGSVTCAAGFFLQSVTDDKSNTYTILDHISDPSGQENYTFYLGNITNGPTTITATFNGNVNFRGILWDEYAGVVALANPLDGHAANLQNPGPGTATDAVTSTSITTKVNGDLIWGATVNSNSFNNATTGTGFTPRGALVNTGSLTVPQNTEDRLQATAGAVAATFTDTASFGTWSTFIIALKAAAGGGGTLALRTATLGAGFGRVAATGKAPLAARSAAEGAGRAALTGRVPLAAKSAGRGTAKLTFTGKLGLAARSLAAATGRALPPGAHAVLQLIANGFAMAAGRLRLIGTVPLAGAGRASAQGRAQPRVNAVLATISKAAGQARAGATFAARMAASSAAHGAGKATVAARATFSAVSLAAGRATGAMAGKVSLAARTMAVSRGRVLPSGIQQYVQLAASGFAAAMGRVWVFMRSPRAAIVLFENRSAQPLDDRVTEVPMENRSAVVPPRGVAEVADEDRTAVVPPG